MKEMNTIEMQAQESAAGTAGYAESTAPAGPEAPQGDLGGADNEGTGARRQTPEENARFAAMRRRQEAQQREERVPRWPFVVMGLIAALIGIAILIVPAGIERRRSEEAAVYNRVEDPLITATQQPDAATAAPYTYRLVGVEWVDYDGEWMLPRGCGLLRVELAVSAAKRVDWAPEPP